MRTPTPAIPDVHPPGLVDHDALRAASRRRVLTGVAVVAGAAVAGAPLGALAQATSGRLPVTPNQALGPFYPADIPAEHDADMTLLGASKDRAQGMVIYVSGRVLTPNGAPVANATLDIWQANAAGRYAHPTDRNKAPLDANFQGFARIHTTADGSYAFKSIKPGAYPTGSGDWIRPPHIHFDVRGRTSRVITQMYFEGEPLNAKDRLLNAVRNQDTLVARLDAAGGRTEKGALAVRWDVVLASG